MSGVDSREVLWQSVSALMRKHWGKENITRLGREAKIGVASAARIKKQQTSVGLEVLDQIAEAFHIDTWQLLVPGMDADNMPTLLPMSEKEREFQARMMQAVKDLRER